MDNQERQIAPQAEPLQINANGYLQADGFVVNNVKDYYFESRGTQADLRNGTVSAIVFVPRYNQLYVLPRKLYSKEHLEELERGISKSRLGKLSKEVYSGAQISKMKVQDQVITEFNRDNAIPWKLRDPLYENNVGMDSDDTTELRFLTMCSPPQQDGQRLLFCEVYFMEPLPFEVPQHEINKLLPNVPYTMVVQLKIDFKDFKPHMHYNKCHPTGCLKFVHFSLPKFRVINSKFPTDYDKLVILKINSFAKNALWNHNRDLLNPQIILPRPFTYYRPIYGSPNLSTGPSAYRYTVTQCLVVGPNELFCREYPNAKCLLPVRYHHDKMAILQGTTLWCRMYYSELSKAWIVYHYGYRLTEYGTEERQYFDFGVDNPMKVRWTKDGPEYLAYIKANEFNHYYSCYAVSLVDDPQKLMHGREKLGNDRQVTTVYMEREQGKGTPAWIRYVPDARRVAKFSIVDLAVTKDCPKIPDVKHQPFVSKGLLLNRQGFVASPHVCNFPIVLDNYARIEANMKWEKRLDDGFLDVGAWIEFIACFDEEKQQYVISEVIGVRKNCAFKVIKLADEEDEFAFLVPNCHTNFKYSMNLLTNFDGEMALGLLEDTTWDIALFMRYFNADYQRSVPLWCCENHAPNRQTQLKVLGIENPPPAGRLYKEVSNDD